MQPAKAYDRIISLGYDCRLAYNLRRTFGIDQACPFDWWVTPMAALIRFLEHPSIDELYAPDALTAVPSPVDGSIMTIENPGYGIQLFHDFPREPKTLQVLDDWRDHIPAAQARTRHLQDRMLGAPRSERLLFVRASVKLERRQLGIGFEPLAQQIEPALRRLFPHHEFDLLFIDPRDDIQGPNVRTLHVGDTAKDPWYGTPELWSERLLGAGISWAGQGARSGPEAGSELR